MKPGNARSGKLVAGILLIIGLVLLAGAGAAYYYIIERPKGWPMTDGVVVSSRVVNPRNPSQYQPEIVFRYTIEGVEQETAIVAAWSSSSYDSVRSYVDRYPAGSAVTLAVNPADSTDVQYELGPTLVNLLAPGIMATLGAIFSIIGAVSLRPATRRPMAAASAQALRRMATTFTIIGVVMLTIGGWMASRSAAMLREWPRVDAEVVEAAIVSQRSGARSSPSPPVYDVQVTFTYEVSGTRLVSQTTTGLATSSRDRIASLLKQYSKGTHHQVYHRPDDPNVIRFDASRLSVFGTAGGLVLMGVVFLGFGLAFLKFGPKSP